jgi:hypothetical protein
MKNGVELFTPWTWDIGMWEALHLFSRYNQANYVQSTSADETIVSAYTTIDVNNDSMAVVLINRSLTEKKVVTLNFTDYYPAPGGAPMYTLSKLGTTETFVSHAKNALVKSGVEVSMNQVTVELAPLSINTIRLIASRMAVKPDLKKNSFTASIYPNPANNGVHLEYSLPERSTVRVDLFNSKGQLLRTISNQVIDAGKNETEFGIEYLSPGIYLVKLSSESNSQTLKLVKN